MFEKILQRLNTLTLARSTSPPRGEVNKLSRSRGVCARVLPNAISSSAKPRPEKEAEGWCLAVALRYARFAK
jgi:hypothetical protein